MFDTLKEKTARLKFRLVLRKLSKNDLTIILNEIEKELERRGK